MSKSYIKGLMVENPVLTAMLGVVTILGTTTSLTTAAVMALMTCVVLVCANLFVYFVREYLKSDTELLIYILTLALFVTVVGVALKMLSLTMSERLGIYVSMILLNCLILNTLEQVKCASGLRVSVVNSLKSCGYFVVVIMLVAFVRELFGVGELFGFDIVSNKIPRMLILVTPAGGFFTLAVFAFVANFFRKGS